jgi:hypothetical protein
MECGGPLRGPRWFVATVDGGPEKGRIVYGKFLGAARTATGEVRRAASGWSAELDRVELPVRRGGRVVRGA